MSVLFVRGKVATSCVLRAVDADGGDGLTGTEMVKYAASDNGKNGQS